MLTGSVSGLEGLDAILVKLRQVQNLDLTPLSRTVAEIIERDNTAALSAGIDANGQPMAPLAKSTEKHRVGSGPPGASLFNDFAVDVRVTPTGLEIVAGYRDGEKARFFSEGTRNQPARPLAGIRPETATKIQAALDDFARRLTQRL